MRARRSSKFGQARPLTAELTDIERPHRLIMSFTELTALDLQKIDSSTFSRLLFFHSILNLYVSRKGMISRSSNFGRMEPPHIELSALERLKITP